MSLEQKLTQLAIAVGTDVKSLNDRLGLNANLTTTQKATFVGAINEIVANIGDMTELQSYIFATPNPMTGDVYSWTLITSDTSNSVKYYGYQSAAAPANHIIRFDSATGVLTSYDTQDPISGVWAGRATYTYTALPSYLSGLSSLVTLGGYTNLVDAILAALDAGNIALALIDDAAGDGVTDKTWSANKIYDSILAAINQLRDDLVNGSGAALDTLKELADALGNDPNFAATIATGLANRVRVDAAQSFTSAQKLQGRENIDAASNTGFQTLNTNLGDVTHDFLADYTTARDLVV